MSVAEIHGKVIASIALKAKYTQIARKGATYKKYQQLCGSREEKLNILWQVVTQEQDYFKLHVGQPIISRDMRRIYQGHNKRSKDYTVK